MHKKLSAIILCICMVLMFAACGESANSGTTATTAPVYTANYSKMQFNHAIASDEESQGYHTPGGEEQFNKCIGLLMEECERFDKPSVEIFIFLTEEGKNDFDASEFEGMNVEIEDTLIGDFCLKMETKSFSAETIKRISSYEQVKTMWIIGVVQASAG